MEIIEECKQRMEKCIENLRASLATLRAGQVSPTVLDKVYANAYGEKMALRDLCSIQTAGATKLVVRPFDPSTFRDVLSAISKADLGVNPNTNGNEIILNFPPLTGERRAELIKHSKEYGEQAKIAIRMVRRDANDLIKKDKTLSKDQAKDIENDIQKETDNRTKEINDLLAKKEKEINTI